MSALEAITVDLLEIVVKNFVYYVKKCLLFVKVSMRNICLFFFFSAKSCIFRQLIYLYLLGTNECVAGNFSFSHKAIRNLNVKSGEGNGNPLQCSCLENPVDRGAWRAAVHRVAQSQTRLKRLSSSMHWRRKWQPTPVFLPGESQGQGSLVGCRLWGCTELDTTDMT